MLNVWLAVPAVLAAAILAACFTYLFNPSQPVEPNRRSPATVSDMTTRPDSRTFASIDQRRSAEDHAVAAFQRAAEAILKRAPNAQASASANEPPIYRRLGPLPNRYRSGHGGISQSRSFRSVSQSAASAAMRSVGLDTRNRGNCTVSANGLTTAARRRAKYLPKVVAVSPYQIIAPLRGSLFHPLWGSRPVRPRLSPPSS
jgi:hypothetical protein